MFLSEVYNEAQTSLKTSSNREIKALADLPENIVHAAIEKEQKALFNTGTLIPLAAEDVPSKENAVNSMTITKVTDDNGFAK